MLLQEFVRTLPRGSASGFSNHSRQSSSKDTDDPPAYSTLSSTIEYVPRTFVNDPSLAPEEIPSALDGTNVNGAHVVDVTAQVGSISKHILLEGVHILLSSNRHENQQ